MKFGKRQWALMAAVMGVAITSAHAATYNYVGGGWDDPASWNSVDGGMTFPQEPGDVANLSNNITGTTTVNVPASGVTIGGINFMDPDGSHSFNVNGGLITFQGAGGPAVINTNPSGTSTNTFNASIGLASDLDINIGLQNLNTAGAFSVNGYTVTLRGTAQNTRWLVNGDLAGDGTIVIQGEAGVDVVGSKSFTGTVVINGGRSGTSNTGGLTLTNGSLSLAQEIVINGALSNGNVQAGGYLHAGNGSASSTNPGQRITENRITLNSGSLFPMGQAAKDDFASQHQAESLQTLSFNSGYSILATSKGGSLSNTITIGELERGVGATGFVQSTTLGGDTKVLVTGFDSSYLKGAGGAAGTKTMSIIPWLGANNGGAGTGNPTTFATYVPGEGIRALVIGAETDTVFAGPTVNAANTGGATLSGDTTVNSLYINHNTTNLNGHTLTITSGGLFVAGTRTIGSAAGGTIDFGSAEGVVWVVAANTATFNVSITGTGGLTKAGTGTMILNQENTYTGLTAVSGGTLEVADGANLGDGNVLIANGALLRLLGSGDIDAIADDAAITLQNFGLFNGKIELAGNETVGALYFGDELQAFGTWGSSLSDAQYKNDTFFSGTGMLTVVPEPATLGAISIGLLALMRRQRREA